MANVKVFQKYVKGHGQGYKFKIYGMLESSCHYAKYESIISKSKKLWPMLILFWRTDRQTDGWTDGPTDRQSDYYRAPG